MTVIPDSIEPVEEWRTWNFDGTGLRSINNGIPWPAGEPMRAMCASSDQQKWTVVRYGMNLERAQKVAESHNQALSQRRSFANPFVVFTPGGYLNAPTVEPPVGYGYALETVRHDAPSAGCTCGLYAAHDPDGCPAGDVLGKVKMWGTIIPGAKGARAEYAYPSELHVPAKLADHPALLAYGVPIVALADKEVAAFSPPRPAPWPKWPVRVAVGLNLGACALNLGMYAIRAIH